MRSPGLTTFAFSVALLLFVGCSGSKEIEKETGFNGIAYYELPRALSDDNLYSEIIESYREVFEGMKIFIDPGHGGDDRRNSSHSGELVEADVNLRVALFLGGFLSEAGADVHYSRTDDATIDLLERPAVANRLETDLFISIHHNAPGKFEDYWTDYTSTYYHALPGNYEYEPFNHELAKYIQRDLSYYMMNSGGLGSFDGTYSDYRIYPGDGFAVLRESKMPAVLVECAFHTNRMEEKRLQNEEFNKIQAWGIFNGMGKFFSADRPKIELLPDLSKLVRGILTLNFRAEDENEIEPYFIKTYFDSTEVPFSFDSSNSIIKIEIENVTPGEHVVKVKCANSEGHYALPYEKKILTNF